MSDGFRYTGKADYRGQRTALPGVPADDLDGDEVKRLAKQRGVTVAAFTKDLLASGLYREAGGDAPAPKAEPKADSGKDADKE